MGANGSPAPGSVSSHRSSRRQRPADDLCSAIGSGSEGELLSDTDTLYPEAANGTPHPSTNPLQYLQNRQQWSPAAPSTVPPAATPVALRDDLRKESSNGGDLDLSSTQPNPPSEFTRTLVSPASSGKDNLSNGAASQGASPLTGPLGSGGGSGGGGGSGMGERSLLAEIEHLREAHTQQVQSMQRRMEKVERIAKPLTQEEENEDHLEYMRKWVENLVGNVCASHPDTTDVTVLLRDFKARLRSTLPSNVHVAAPMPAPDDPFSPANPSPPGGSFDDADSSSTGCCVVS